MYPLDLKDKKNRAMSDSASEKVSSGNKASVEQDATRATMELAEKGTALDLSEETDSEEKKIVMKEKKN